MLSGFLVSLVFSCSMTTSTPPPPASILPSDEDIVVEPIIAVLTGTIYVGTSGNDDTGNGTLVSPFKTLSKAVSVAQFGNLISVAAGLYVENVAVIVPPGVSIKGSGVATCTIRAAGVIPSPSGINTSSKDFKLWRHGSMIQLASTTYNTGYDYGSPSQMVAPANGNQEISDITVDGYGGAKTGIWVENRNNVSINNVDFKRCVQRGLVVCRSDMWWYEPIPEGMWVRNIILHDLSFTNCTTDLDNGSKSNSESLGNLCLGGINGAKIYNITINEDEGYGIKFIHVGHFRNVKIYDCTITVPTYDKYWGEDIAIELWNLSWGNEIYNINCTTWLSLVNHAQLFEAYRPTEARPSNMKVYNVRMIHPAMAPLSTKESIECAIPGLEVYNCYFKDKGFGMAIWDSGGYMVNIHNNIFYTTGVKTNFAGGAAIYLDNSTGRTYSDITIHNNVFDTQNNAIRIGNNAVKVSVRNNLILNTTTKHILSSSTDLLFANNMTTVTLSKTGTMVDTGNIVNADPGLTASGDRWDTWYKPASGASPTVNAGINVGQVFKGTAPDIGAFEWLE